LAALSGLAGDRRLGRRRETELPQQIVVAQDDPERQHQKEDDALFHALAHRVVAAWMEGMALQQAQHRPRRPSADAVPRDRVGGIRGAGGLEPAGGWKQRRDPASIETDQGEAAASQGRSFMSPSRRSAAVQWAFSVLWEIVSASRRGKTSTSRP